MPSHRRQGGGSKQQKQTGKKSQEEEELDSILEAYQRKAETQKDSTQKPTAPKKQTRGSPPPPAPPGFDGRFLLMFRGRQAMTLTPGALMKEATGNHSSDDISYLCDLALYKDPRCSLAWYHKGILFENSGTDYDRALVCYRRALEYDQTFLEAARCGLMMYFRLRDFEALFSTVDEYLDLARHISNREKRTVCLRSLLRVVLWTGSVAQRFSETVRYFNELVEIVKENPSLEALQELGRHLTEWARWIAFSKESRGDFSSEFFFSCEDQETVERMLTQAESCFEQASGIPLKGFLDEKRCERKAMDPYFRVGKEDICVDTFTEEFRFRTEASAAIRSETESEFGNKQLGAKRLEETGFFDKAARAYYEIDNYASAIRLVENHAGSAESTPNQSRRLYFIGAISLFSLRLHLKRTDPTRSPAAVGSVRSPRAHLQPYKKTGTHSSRTAKSAWQSRLRISRS